METTKYIFNDIVIGEEGLLKGPFGSDLKKELYVPKGEDTYKVYLQENILKQNNIAGEHYISKDYYEKSMKRYAVKEGDFIVTCDGTLGEIFQLKNLTEPGIISSSLLRITLDKKKCDEKFFPYFFKAKMKMPLITQANNSVLKHLPGLTNIRNFSIDLPLLTTQKKIASVLSALDDKIALNKKMNQKLEAMAKRLYDYWFVQYDFPDKNGRPYKTTGGPMTYNPTLKREIPVGWEVSNICPLMEILPGGTPSKAKPEYWNGDIPFFGPTDYCGDVFQLSTEEHITENGLNNCASALYPPKTIFITARGSVGKLIVCGKPMAMNQSCYALKPFDLEKYEYLFYLTKQLIEQLKKKGSGSVFKSINTLDIEQSFMSIAPNEIIDLYCKKVKSIFERIKGNTVEIAKLTTLRDKLLPLLMNGQVVVH